MTSISSFYANAYAQVSKSATPSQSAVVPSNAALSTTEPTTPDVPKPFSSLILDVRASLDAGYQKLGKKGDDYTTRQDWGVVGLNDLDRRSLYAIASNQGGLFSQAEINSAQSLMTSQESNAMVAADPSGTDVASRLKAAIDFLDDVSPEEKSSLGWAQERASAQAGYEQRMKDEGRVPEDVSTDNIFVNLFVSAYHELSATNDASQDVRNMPSWQKAIELWRLGNETGQSLSWTL